MLEHDGVGLTIGEGERRAAAPHVIAIAGTVAGVPMHVLLHHGLTQFFE